MSTMKYRKFVIFLFFCTVIFPKAASCGDHTPLTIKFGINSTDSPKVVAQKILPILAVLEKDLKKRLKRAVKITFKVFRTYDDSIKAFVDGSVDFGRLGPASYVLAKKQAPGINLLAMENRKGKKRFNGLIIVKKDSPLQALSDLKGQRFAFGNKICNYSAFSVCMNSGHSPLNSKSSASDAETPCFRQVEM